MAGFSNPIIGGGGALVYPSIHSPNFITEVSGWTINKDGSAEFNNLTIRGTFMGTDFEINANGAFFYSGTPALGTLFLAITTGATSDSFGNVVSGSGINIGTWSALGVQQQHLGIQANGNLFLVDAAGETHFFGDTPQGFTEWLNATQVFAAMAWQSSTDLNGATLPAGFSIGTWSGPAGSLGQGIIFDPSGHLFMQDSTASYFRLDYPEYAASTYVNYLTNPLLISVISAIAGNDSYQGLGDSWGPGYTGPISAWEPGTQAAGAAAPETWHAPSLGTGWASGSTVSGAEALAYRVTADGMLELSGAIHSTSATPAGTIFTLPAGWRPAGGGQNGEAHSNHSGTFAVNSCAISTAGVVTLGVAIAASSTDVYFNARVRMT